MPGAYSEEKRGSCASSTSISFHVSFTTWAIVNNNITIATGHNSYREFRSTYNPDQEEHTITDGMAAHMD